MGQETALRQHCLRLLLMMMMAGKFGRFPENLNYFGRMWNLFKDNHEIESESKNDDGHDDDNKDDEDDGDDEYHADDDGDGGEGKMDEE